MVNKNIFLLSAFSVLTLASPLFARIPAQTSKALNYLIEHDSPPQLMNMMTCQEVTDPENPKDDTYKTTPVFASKKAPTSQEFLLMMKSINVMEAKNLQSGYDPLPRLNNVMGDDLEKTKTYKAHLFWIMLAREYFKERKSNPFLSDATLRNDDLRAQLIRNIALEVHQERENERTNFFRHVSDNKNLNSGRSLKFLFKLDKIVADNPDAFKATEYQWDEHTVANLKENGLRAAEAWFYGEKSAYPNRDLTPSYRFYSPQTPHNLSNDLTRKFPKGEDADHVDYTIKHTLLKCISDFIHGMWADNAPKRQERDARKEGFSQGRGAPSKELDWQKKAREIGGRGLEILHDMDSQTGLPLSELSDEAASWIKKARQIPLERKVDIDDAIAVAMEESREIQAKQTFDNAIDAIMNRSLNIQEDDPYFDRIKSKVIEIIEKLNSKDYIDFDLMLYEVFLHYTSSAAREARFAKFKNAHSSECFDAINAYGAELEKTKAHKDNLDQIAREHIEAFEKKYGQLSPDLFDGAIKITDRTQKPIITDGQNHLFSGEEEKYFMNSVKATPMTDSMYFSKNLRPVNRLVRENKTGSVSMQKTNDLDRRLAKVKLVGSDPHEPIYRYIRLDTSLRLKNDVAKYLDTQNYELWIQVLDSHTWFLFAVPLEDQEGDIVSLSSYFRNIPFQDSLRPLQEVFLGYHPEKRK